MQAAGTYSHMPPEVIKASATQKLVMSGALAFFSGSF